ncbi:MAG: M1 family aminopeptidase [Geitlerinemataceae cyanobacterium]
MSHAFFAARPSHHRFELPGAKPQYKPDRPGQVKHIALDLAIDFENQSFGGRCTVRLDPVRDGLTLLALDAVDLTIEAVKVGDAAQDYDHDGKVLNVSLATPTATGKTIELAIDYRVENPRRGLYFVAPTDIEPDKPVQAWTQGEDEDSRFWFPCFDYPGQLSTSEIRVRVPQEFIAVSNGELISTEEQGVEKVYHWSQKEVHPTYLMTLAIGKFAEVRDEWDGIPVTYYVERDRLDDVERTMGKTPRMVEFFSKTYGHRYAFPKYAQVCVDDFIFGGMENTSTTLLTSRCLLDERAAIDDERSESLVAHELAHQWFGDLVVIDHWSHAWIKEGAASYSEVQWFEHERGKDDGAYYLLGEARSYLAEDSGRYRRPIVTHVYREAIELYDSHLYEKGACVYHMIRAELGDELFNQAIAKFVNDNAHSTVETIDLIRAIESATGRNLRYLFDQYVYRGGHPDYKVSYEWDGDSNLAKLTIEQTQAKKEGTTPLERGLFDLKIPIAFGFTSEDLSAEPTLQTVKVRVNEPEQSFYFPLASKPAFVSFDAGNATLKTVSLKYPTPELKAQLKSDPDPISRLYAAHALAKKGGIEVIKALGEALTGDRFWGVRKEVAAALSSIETVRAFETLKAGLKDEDARVRAGVVAGLGKYKTPEAFAAAATVLKTGDRSYTVESAAAVALGKIAAAQVQNPELTDRAIAVLKDTLETRAGWNSIVQSGAVSGLSKLTTSEAALNLLLEYTRAEVPQALRRRTIWALGSASVGQTEANVNRVLDRFSQLVAEEFFLVQVSAVSGLESMTTPKAIGILQTLRDRTADGRVIRMCDEAIREVQDSCSGDRALDRLRDELDEVKQQNRDLLGRLDALEAKSKA